MLKVLRENAYLFLPSVCGNVMKFAKNGSFIDEDEIRLYFDANTIKETLNLMDGMKKSMNDDLYSDMRVNFLKTAEQFDIAEDNFVMTRTGIRSYRNLCLDYIWGFGVIPEVILVPMCVQNKSELHKFLKCNGLEGTKIKISSVPIR